MIDRDKLTGFHSKPISDDKDEPSKYEEGLPSDCRVVHSDEPNPDDGA